MPRLLTPEAARAILARESSEGVGRMKAMLLVPLLLLAACGEPVDPQPEAGTHYDIPAFTWHVVDTQELRRVYREAGQPLQDGDRLYGFVGKRGNEHVVYTLPPKTVDDSATCTLGHEVMHLALGDYHQ